MADQQSKMSDVRCEACEAGLRLGEYGIHYDDSRDGQTWGVCRKVVAALAKQQSEETVSHG